MRHCNNDGGRELAHEKQSVASCAIRAIPLGSPQIDSSAYVSRLYFFGRHCGYLVVPRSLSWRFDIGLSLIHRAQLFADIDGCSVSLGGEIIIG